MDCRFCQYYHFEGHRQGQCLLLGQPVTGSLPACCLALPPFVSSCQLPIHLNGADQGSELPPASAPVPSTVPEV